MLATPALLGLHSLSLIWCCPLELQAFRTQADAEPFVGRFARSWLEISELPHNERSMQLWAGCCLPAASHREHQFVFSLLGLRSMPKALKCSAGKDLPEIRKHQYFHLNNSDGGSGRRQSSLKGPRVIQIAMKGRKLNLDLSCSRQGPQPLQDLPGAQT